MAIYTIFAPTKGKMQEWLNWPAWKASKPQKGFGGSNPPLSAAKKRSNKIASLFCCGNRSNPAAM